MGRTKGSVNKKTTKDKDWENTLKDFGLNKICQECAKDCNRFPGCVTVLHCGDYVKKK